MGCCNSAPTAPENIIPDPGEAEPCTFSLKSAGMMSSDYIAYQGEETSDKEKKWFFVNKTGSMWGGDAVIEKIGFLKPGCFCFAPEPRSPSIDAEKELRPCAAFSTEGGSAPSVMRVSASAIVFDCGL